MLIDLKLSLICLVETRVRIINKPNVIKSVFKDWDMLDNYNSHSLGRIWVGWDPEILKVSKNCETDQIIHCHACLLDNYDTFRISFVYGSNDNRARRALWENMCANLSAGTPWIVLGDFNVARNFAIFLS